MRLINCVLVASVSLATTCAQVDDRFDLVLCEKWGHDAIVLDSATKTGGFSDAPSFPILVCEQTNRVCMRSPLVFAVPTDERKDASFSSELIEASFLTDANGNMQSVIRHKETGDIFRTWFDEKGELVTYSVESEYGNIEYIPCRGSMDLNKLASLLV